MCVLEKFSENEKKSISNFKFTSLYFFSLNFLCFSSLVNHPPTLYTHDRIWNSSTVCGGALWCVSRDKVRPRPYAPEERLQRPHAPRAKPVVWADSVICALCRGNTGFAPHPLHPAAQAYHCAVVQRAHMRDQRRCERRIPSCRVLHELYAGVLLLWYASIPYILTWSRSNGLCAPHHKLCAVCC